jgi:hypothetical protein
VAWCGGGQLQGCLSAVCLGTPLAWMSGSSGPAYHTGMHIGIGAETCAGAGGRAGTNEVPQLIRCNYLFLFYLLGQSTQDLVVT